MTITDETLLFFAALWVVLLDRLKHRFHLFALLALPSTFAHEAMHYLVAWLGGGRPTGFSIRPRRLADGYHLGQVVTRNATWYNQGPISLAPLLLIPLAYWAMRHLPPRLPLGHGVAYAYVMAALLYGSLPSGPDWRLAWQAPAGTLAALALYGGGIYGVMVW